MPAPVVPAEDPSIACFALWLRQHRGIGARTIGRYRRTVGPLMAELGRDPRLYDAARIREVLLGQFADASWFQARWLATVMRMYLRFLAAEGACSPALIAAVPTGAGLAVGPAAAPCVGGCHRAGDRGLRRGDPRRAQGPRDPPTSVPPCPSRRRYRRAAPRRYRLAQRAGPGVRQVAARDPSAASPGCGRCRPRLYRACPPAGRGRPGLPEDTRALPALRVQQLNHQPGHSGPEAGPGMEDVRPRGAYLFRHSAATHLLRSGVSIEVICTLLRHRSVDTSLIYAKTDRPMLVEVAQPWPGDAS